MAIYITDDNKETVRTYCTSSKVQRAIEVILKDYEHVIGSETEPGHIVLVVKKQ